MHGLPKIIWLFWLQGWDRAPRLVRACRRSWELHNPGWAIHCLDRLNAANFISNGDAHAALDDLDQPPQVSAERLRIALVAQHGGVWADATTYCLRPLDDWLFEVLGSGFFAFENPFPDRLISTWFLAAKPGNDVLQRWAEVTREYWTGRSQRDAYFWLNYVFAGECAKNPTVRAIWDQPPKISAAGPAYYLPTEDVPLWAPLTDRDRDVITAAYAPLLKLTHRLPQGDYPTDSVAEYLCKRIGV
jgi:hypothetical protein